MKNIHVLPTDKPSRLFIYNGDLGCAKVFQYGSDAILNQHIYITDDSEIKDCYYFNSKDNAVRKNNNSNHPYHHKIILTTDQDLIKDGVQAVEEDFLNWFVKNSSCDSVEILEAPKLVKMIDNEFYKIIIPKEEPKPFKNMLPLTKVDWEKFKKNPIQNKKEEHKQETLEEAFKNCLINKEFEVQADYIAFKGAEFGAKWQQERMYSEEDMKKLIESHSDFIYYKIDYEGINNATTAISSPEWNDEEWFEQFKNK